MQNSYGVVLASVRSVLVHRGWTMDGRLLDVPQVAQMLGVSQWLCWQLVWTGELRSVKVGRFVRVRPADVDRYLETADADRYREKARARAARLAATRAARLATHT